jgi:hypothetical protein
VTDSLTDERDKDLYMYREYIYVYRCFYSIRRLHYRQGGVHSQLKSRVPREQMLQVQERRGPGDGGVSSIHAPDV